MKTLLEKAKEVNILHLALSKRATDEDIELVLAWLKSEVTLVQVCEVKGVKPQSRGSIYNYLAIVLRKAFQEGKLKIY